MPPIILNAAGWAGLGLLSLIFYANALGIVDQARTKREIMEAGAPERLARLAVAAGRVWQFVAATALFFRPTRPFAALALVGFLAVATLTAHAFWNSTPETRNLQLANFLKNTAMIGGLLVAATWGGCALKSLDADALDFLHAPSDAIDPPVTVIREMRVRPAHQAQFERLMSAVISEALRQPGHLGATVVRPHATGDAYRFIYKFDRRSNLEAWHASAVRARLVAPVAALIDSEHLDQYPGLKTWFERPSHANAPFTPPKWKTTLMSWAAIYVLVVALSYAMHAVRFEASIPVRAFILTVIVVPIVAYVIGPWLGRRLHGWLHAGLPRAS